MTDRTADNKYRCECRDPDCPVCKGKCSERTDAIAYRVDQEDITGTAFCMACLDDATDSGLFYLGEQGE